MYTCLQCQHQYPAWYFASLQEDELKCKYCEKGLKNEGVSNEYSYFTERISYNYSEAEIQVLLEFLDIQQNLLLVLKNYQYDMKELFHSLLYDNIQQLIRVDVLYWLHHADLHEKKLKDEKDLLLKIREIVCDWLNMQPPSPEQEYKLRSKERSKLEITCVKRTVLPSMAQIVVLQSLLSVFADPQSKAMNMKFIPRGTLLRPSDYQLIQEHQAILQDCVNLSSFQYCIDHLASSPFYCLTEIHHEYCPLFNIPSSFHFTNLLSSFILKHIFKLSASTVLLPLILFKSALTYQKQHGEEDSWLTDEIEKDVGVYINNLITRIVRKLYRWCKACAVYQMNEEKSLPSPLILNVLFILSYMIHRLKN